MVRGEGKGPSTKGRRRFRRSPISCELEFPSFPFKVSSQTISNPEIDLLYIPLRMSYADIHPVHSPYSPAGGGPVSIQVGGLFEEEEEWEATPYDEQMEWDIPSQQDPRELGRARSLATRDDPSVGWGGSEMEWETTSHEPAVSLVLLRPFSFVYRSSGFRIISRRRLKGVLYTPVYGWNASGLYMKRWGSSTTSSSLPFV